MKKIYFLILFSLLAWQCSTAQSTENKSWSIDYNVWNDNGTPALSIDCGSDDTFNFIEDFTLETWVRAYNFVENRKLIGKCFAGDNVFDNGYIMGFISQTVYTEYFNPNSQQVPIVGNGPIPVDSAYVHLASVYSLSEGKLFNYINGELSGESDMFPSAGVSPEVSPFIIGNAPWDLFSFQFYGDLDEVRVWNSALSAEQIRQNLHIPLSGNEDDLIAWYDFNEATGETVQDSGPNGFNGTLSNSDHISTSFATSSAPVANAEMRDMTEIQAAWFRTEENFHKISSDMGLSVTTNIAEKEFWKYLVMGNTNGFGMSSENGPSTAPLDFTRTDREWYVKCSSSVNGTFTFDLVEAEAAQIQDNSPLNQYALLWRPSTDVDYIALAHPTSPIDGIFQFQNFNFMDGYYAFGYAAVPFELQTGIADTAPLDVFNAYPNPSEGMVNFSGTQPNDIIHVYNPLGKLLLSERCNGNTHQLQLNRLPKGAYQVVLSSTNRTQSQRIILQ